MDDEFLLRPDPTFLEALNSIDWGPIAFKLMHPEEGEGRSLEQITIAIDRYRKFLLLSHLYPEQSLVPTREIDQVWHCHILDTEKYRQDCQHLFGRFIDHWPYLGLGDQADRQLLQERFEQTQDLFESHFGIGALG